MHEPTARFISPAAPTFARKVGDFPADKRPGRSGSGLGDIYQMDVSALHELVKYHTESDPSRPAMCLGRGMIFCIQDGKATNSRWTAITRSGTAG